MEKIKEKLPFSKLILLAFQMFIVIFPATVVVPLITGFDVATCLFCTALSTLVFVFVTKGEIPLYFGSSFSYISTIATLMVVTKGTQDHKIGMMTFGLLFSGLVNIIIGLLINRIGFDRISKVITPFLCCGIEKRIGCAGDVCG
jgi:uracil permease